MQNGKRSSILEKRERNAVSKVDTEKEEEEIIFEIIEQNNMDSNNNNNQIIDLNDLTSSNQNTSTSASTDILWNENEETFLQNLFANTLLNDDFSKNSDFDLGLGFDNLQLTNTTPVVANVSLINETNTSVNPAQTNEDPLLIIQDLKLTNSNQTNQQLSIEDFLTTDTTQISLLDFNLNADKTPISQTVSSSNSLTDDDKLFKRPSNDFLTSTSNIILKSPLKVFKTLNNSKKEKKAPSKQIQQQQKESKITNTNGSEASQQQTTNMSISKLKRSRKRSKFLNNHANASEHHHIVTLNKTNLKQLNRQTNASNSSCSKLIVKNSKPNLRIDLNTFEPLSKKFAPAPNSLPIKTAVSSNDASSCNLSTNNSDLEKNIFVLNENSKIPKLISSNNLLTKRDEFDLQIKELSLLDLHSSEDDSSNDLSKKNANQIKLKQTPSKEVAIELPEKTKFTTVSLTNEDPVVSQSVPDSTHSNNINEIISKRIKYSANTPQDQQEKQTEISKTNFDKFIQYFKSLDSPSKETVVASQTTTNVPKQSKDSSKKSLDSLLSPPSPSNLQKSQNKRKKKDTNQQDSHPIILISFTPDKTSNPPQQIQSLTLNIENDTLQHMKNLDLNNSAPTRAQESSNKSLSLNLSDKNSRSYLWNLLKANSSQEELIEHFGSALHDKISFWDLVQLKLKFSKVNHLKTTYEIIDDYTLLYSNMSALLERFVNEQSNFASLGLSGLGLANKKVENSSRSRSSSRNLRKQSTSSSTNK